MFKRKFILLLFIMLMISLAGVLIVKMSGSNDKSSGGTVIVTSFYPMYVLTLNITEGIKEIEVTSLMENQAGCAHDYTLSTKDMKVMSNADIFIMNGGGMEEFAAKAINGNSNIKVIDTSEGIDMLEGTEHEHHHDEEYNAHIWMSIDAYMMQLETAAKKLTLFIPSKKDIFIKNKENYKDKLLNLKEVTKELSEKTRDLKVILFHEAFAYLADDLEMEVMHMFPLDEDTSLNPKETAEMIDMIKRYDIKLLFVEEDYLETIQKIIGDAADVKICFINPLTTGTAEMDSYIKDYRNNLRIIEEAVSLLSID